MLRLSILINVRIQLSTPELAHTVLRGFNSNFTARFNTESLIKDHVVQGLALHKSLSVYHDGLGFGSLGFHVVGVNVTGLSE